MNRDQPCGDNIGAVVKHIRIRDTVESTEPCKDTYEPKGDVVESAESVRT